MLLFATHYRCDWSVSRLSMFCLMISRCGRKRKHLQDYRFRTRPQPKCTNNRFLVQFNSGLECLHVLGWDFLVNHLLDTVPADTGAGGGDL